MFKQDCSCWPLDAPEDDITAAVDPVDMDEVDDDEGEDDAGRGMDK